MRLASEMVGRSQWAACYVLTWCGICGVCAFEANVSGAELKVPAFTAYALPEPNSLRISPRGSGVAWDDAAASINWWGWIAQAGPLDVRVVLDSRSAVPLKLQMTVGNESRQVEVTGQPGQEIVADFGQFKIAAAGHQHFELKRVDAGDEDGPVVTSLVLDGSAAAEAQFNLKPRRNAASVHLAYRVPDETNVAAMYAEVTALEDPVTTFYMACGWHRGYFGMQVNSPTERRIIFSVWDSGSEGVDRNKVGAADRVQLVAKGPDVVTNDFGNEGTGGHSHLTYAWKTGEKQRFLVTAEPVSKTETVYAGYYFHPDQRRWVVISAWKAPHEGGYLRGLHSFSENFGGSTGHLLRRARFGNQWIRTDGGDWQELTQASFSHDPTGRHDRRDRYMGVEAGEFFLSHGGFLDGYTEFGQEFTRPAAGRSPAEIELPALKDFQP
ncbi:MAG: DUF3472 domain-containing protein [Pirellulales bacterium]